MDFAPYRFRPVDQWKSAIMNLPLFFELMRSIFGNIKTPYNKQRLLDDLFILLSRDDIRKTISSYIDEDDRRIIAATALLNDPPPGELEDFFQGEKNSAILRGLLLNLEERLILFRFNDGTGRRLALNPVLEPVLGPLAAKTDVLFPGRPAKAHQTGNTETDSFEQNTDGNFSVSDDRKLGMFLAFVSAEEDFFKAEGIRKKVREQGKKLFSDLDLDTAVEVLIVLGLYYAEGEKFLPVKRKIGGFAELFPRERQEYWAAGLYINLNAKKDQDKYQGSHGIAGNQGKSLLPGSFGFSGNHINNLAGMIHRFCRYLDPGKEYPKKTLQRLLCLCEREKNGGFNDFPEIIKPQIFLDSLVSPGILHDCGNEYYRYCLPAAAPVNPGPVIAVDSSFSFILYPGILLKDILKLSLFSGIKEDTRFGFELTRSSVVRGFDFGLNSETMAGILKEMSGNRIDDDLIWTLKDWESRYNSVLLHEGLILYLSENDQYLAETEPVAALIQKKISPGLFILSGESAEAAAALQKAGVDIVARPRPQIPEVRSSSGAFPPLGRTGGIKTAGTNSGRIKTGRTKPENTQAGPELNDTASGNLRDETKNYFLNYLEKMKITKPDREELKARINRGVILTEAQLDSSAIKHRKLEAKGLDYPGKISIVKQALADGSVLEVSRTDPETGTNTAAGVPLALEKKETENILVLKQLDDEEIVRIPLGKISLLRMIRHSIFSY